MNQKTALLIFANSAAKEVERKEFLSTEIFSALNKQTLKKAKKSKLPYFVVSEKEQIGISFGERFTNAIDSIFKKGFDNVITIGNDTPHLKTKHLLEANTSLANKQLVIGPSKDGGFYLMGIKKAHFNKEIFLKLPWQTNKLQASIDTISTIKKEQISFLELLIDLDNLEDVKTILESFKTLSLDVFKLLKKTIIAIKPIVFSNFSFHQTSSFTKNYNKGSPLFFAYL
ncbi:TIGR04282 family arsenosugar biosynthesis glycosyltransferase [Polaribacter sp. OB-PA-B3]